MENEKEFLNFMSDRDEDIDDNTSDAMHAELMKEAVTEYNRLNNTSIDEYDGFMLWVKRTWKKQS